MLMNFVEQISWNVDYQSDNKGHVILEMCAMLDRIMKMVSRQLRMPTPSDLKVSQTEFKDDVKNVTEEESGHT